MTAQRYEDEGKIIQGRGHKNTQGWGHKNVQE